MTVERHRLDMRNPATGRSDHPETPVVGTFIVATLLGMMLVVASYPVEIGIVVGAITAVFLTSRGLWRRATRRGIGLPGLQSRVWVVTSTHDTERAQWSFTIAIVDSA